MVGQSLICLPYVFLEKEKYYVIMIHHIGESKSILHVSYNINKNQCIRGIVLEKFQYSNVFVTTN